MSTTTTTTTTAAFVWVHIAGSLDIPVVSRRAGCRWLAVFIHLPSSQGSSIPLLVSLPSMEHG